MDDTSSELLRLLPEVTRALQQAVESALPEYGIHAAQFFVLKELWREDGLTPHELAERLKVTVPTITRAVQRMETNGVVVRKRHERDARLVRVELTSRGRELRQPVEKVVRQRASAAFRRLSRADRERLVKLLLQIRHTLVSPSS